MNIGDYYIGSRNKVISIEKAEAEDLLVEWKCKQGHIFETTVSLAETVINEDYCPCCRKLKGLEYDASAIDCTEPNSLFSLDYELFDGQISEKYIQSGNNYINAIKYNSLNGLDWNIGGRLVTMSPASIVKRFTEVNQAKLKDTYERQTKYGRLFEIIKCEACGKYIPHYKGDRIKKNEKCLLCNDYIHNPFSFGRWLDEHWKIKKRLQELLSADEYKKLYGLDKCDMNTKIIIPAEVGIKTTTVFDITHKNIKL